MEFFNKWLSHILKKQVEISYTSQNIFTSKNEDDNKKEFVLGKAKQ